MGRSLRDRYAQQNKGKVAIAGKGLVNRTARTAQGKTYTYNEGLKRLGQQSEQRSTGSSVQRNTENSGPKRTVRGVSYENMGYNIAAGESGNAYEVARAREDIARQNDKQGKIDWETNAGAVPYEEQLARYYAKKQIEDEAKNKNSGIDKIQEQNKAQMEGGDIDSQLLAEISQKNALFMQEQARRNPEDTELAQKAKEATTIANERTNTVNEAREAAKRYAQNEEIKNKNTARATQDKNMVDVVFSYKNMEGDARAAEYIDKGENKNTAQQKGEELGAQGLAIYNAAKDKGMTDSQALREATKIQNLNADYIKAGAAALTDNDAMLWAGMSDEYKKIYNYLLGKYGENSQEFKNFKNAIRDEVIYNYGQLTDKTIDKYYEDDVLGDFGKVAGKTAYSFGTGVFDGSAKGMYNLGAMLVGDKGVGTTYLNAGQQGISQNAEGLEKLLYDLAYTEGNMLPSILTGQVASSVLGNIVMGAGIAGNSYAQAREEGYSYEQAVSYSLVNSSLEVFMERFLGGIDGLAAKGGLTKMIMSKGSAAIERLIKNPKLAFVVSKILGFVGSGGGEFTEEYLQQFLEPIYRNIIFDENNEINFFAPENFEAGFMGLLMASVSNGVSQAGNAVYFKQNGENVRLDGGLEGLVESGKESARGTMSNRLAEDIVRLQESGKPVSDWEISMLMEANKGAIADEEAASRYLDGRGSWGELSQEGKRAMLNPDNIDFNNERYGLEIPRGSNPSEIGQYLREYADSAQRTGRKQGISQNIIEIAQGVQKKTGTKVIFEDMTNSQRNVGEKYSINADFTNVYDKWAKNDVGSRQTGRHFVLGTTSQALQSIGIKDTPIIIDQSKIVKILNKHPEITDDIVKQIPQLLEEPILVMESKTESGSVTVLGEVYGTNGVPVMAALKFKNVGQRNNLEDYSVVTSSYTKATKTGVSKTQNLIDTSEIKYVDPNKNRTDNWLATLGLQLPVHITTYGSIDSVSYSKGDVNIKGSYSKGVIRINSNLEAYKTQAEAEGRVQVSKETLEKRMLKTLAAHEVMHALEENKSYRQIRDFVLKDLESRGVLEEVQYAIAQMYGNEIEGLSETEAQKIIDSETVAKYVEDLFEDADAKTAEQRIRELYSKDKNVFQKIYDAIKNLVARVKGDSITQAEHLFEKVLNETKSENAQSNETRNAINARFENQYDNWAKKADKTTPIKNRSTRGYFVLGTTSKALQSIGIKDMPIIIDQSKIVKILNKHPEITDDIVKQIPQLLEEPILVMESKTESGSVTVLGEVYGTNGVPVMAALKFKNVGQRNNLEDYSAVTSLYARGKDDTVKATQNLINSSNLLYIEPNKNRTDTWLGSLGLQLPSSAITNYGSINKVSYSKGDVNIPGKIRQENTQYSKGKSVGEILDISKIIDDKVKKAETFEKSDNKFHNNKQMDTKERTAIGILEGVIFGDMNEARRHAQEYSKNNFPKQIEIKEDGMKVGLSQRAINSFFRRKLSVIEYFSFFALPDIIKKAHKVSTLPSISGNNPMNIYQSEFAMNGKTYVATIRIDDNDMGHRYAGHKVKGIANEIKIEPTSDTTVQFQQGTSAESLKSLSLQELDNDYSADSFIDTNLSQDKNTVNANIRQNNENDTKKFSITDKYSKGGSIEEILAGKNGENAAEYFKSKANGAQKELLNFMPQAKSGGAALLREFAKDVLARDTAAYKEAAALWVRYGERAKEAGKIIARINSSHILSEGEKQAAEDISRGNRLNLVQYGSHAQTIEEYAQALKQERYIDEKTQSIFAKAFEEQKGRAKEVFDELYDNAFMEDSPEQIKIKEDIIKRLKSKMYVAPHIKAEFGDDYHPRMHGFNLTGNVNFNTQGNSVDSHYEDLSEVYPQYFPKDIINPADRLKKMTEVKEALETPNLLKEVYGEEYKRAAQEEFANMLGSIKKAAQRAMSINEIDIPQNIKNSEYYKGPAVKYLENTIDYDALTSLEIKAKKQAVTNVLKSLEKMYGSFTQTEKAYAVKIAEGRMSADNLPDGIDRAAVLSYAEAYRIRFASELAETKRKALTDRALKKLKELKKVAREKGLSEADKSEIMRILGRYDYVSAFMSKQGELDTRRLAEEYRNILDEHPNAAITKGLEDKLNRLDKIRVSEMTADELYDLIQDVSAMEYSVRHMNDVLGVQQAEKITDAARQSIRAVEASKGFAPTTNRLFNAMRNQYGMNHLRPQTFFEQITGYDKAGSELYEMLNEGTVRKAKFKGKATSLFDKFNSENKEFIEKMSGKDADWIEIEAGGKKYEITPAMRISLYLHSKNDANLRHFSEAISEVKGEDGKTHLQMLMGQGITIPNRKYYNKGMKSEAYLYGDTVKFTRAELAKIFEGMTAQEREFANLAHRYFNEVSKKAINETSMTLEGIETAQVDNYFPLQSDPNKLRQGKDVKAMQEALSNIDVTSKGFLKERKNARNAIILDDVTNILLNQIEAVSEYYGFAVAHRNFEAILAQVVSEKEGDVTVDTSTLEEVINKKWGKEATRYIEKLLQDNIGLNKSERSIWGALQGKFASAVLGLNPSVAIKQLSAYPTAGDVVGQKALVKGLLRDATFTPKQVRELDAKIDKYTPMLAIRREGTGIREVGDVLKNNPQWAQKVPYLMQLPGLVDTAVVRKLWGACECYVEDTLGLYKERNESKSYIERAVDEAAKNRAQSAGDNGRHLTDSDLEGYLKTGLRESVRNRKQNLLESGKDIIVRSYSEMKKYVQRILGNEAASDVENRAFGIVSNNLADVIHEVNPELNVYGYYLEVIPSDFKHGVRHTEAAKSGNRSLTLDEITDAIYNLNEKTFEVIEAKPQGNRQQVRLGIKTDNGLIELVAVVSNGRIAIQPKTIIGHTEESYPNLQTNKKTTSQRVPVGGVFHPRSTHTVNSSSDNTVPQNDTKGNKKYVSEEEYYREVAKAFEQCIFRTQQNYTPMQQSQILRDTRTSTKLLTLFSSQNNQNYNVLYEAVGRYRAYKEKYGKGSAEFARAKAQLGRAVVSQILQGATFAGLGVFVKGFIKGAYDDKDEAAQDFFSQLISAFAGTVYGGQELYDLIMSAAKGEEWEGINVAVFGTIKKLGQNIVDLVGAIADIDSSGFTNNNVLQAIRSVSKTVAGLFGVPAENAEAYIKDIVGRVTESASGGEFSFEEWYDGLFYRGTAARVKKASGVKRDTAIDDAIYDGMNSVYGKSGGDEIKRLTQVFADEDGYNISDIYARSAPDRVTYNSRDYILTGSEKDRWLRTQNKAFGELNEFVKSEKYKALSDDEKFKAVAVFAKSAKATADAELAKARKRELLASDNAEDRAQGKKIEISDEYTRLKESGGSLADYAVFEAKVYGGKADYSADKEGYSQKEKKEILFGMDISEKSKAAIYSAVFEDKNTKEEDSVLYAVKQGISAQTFVGFTSQEFEGEDKTGQKRKWLLDNCRDDKELQGMYERFMESEDTEEYKTIGYAAAQGVSPRKFVEFKQAVSEAKGSAGEAKTYSYWRNGKVVTEQYTGTESGSKAQEIYGELLGGGYSDKEIEVLYSMQFSDKIYPYAMEMGISPREYVKFKQAYANIPKGKGKKQRVFEAIESLKLSADKKMLLFCAQGYSLGTENKMRMFRYIDSLELSREQKMILADIMGFRVENGRVYVS